MRLNDELWRTYFFSDLFYISNGINKDKKYFGYGYPIINYMDVNKNAFLSLEKIRGKVDVSNNEIKRYSVSVNDVILTRTSETKDEIAYSSCILDQTIKCVFSGFLLRARPINDLTFAPFIVYQLRSPKYRKKLESISTETSRALINSNNLSKITINIPDKATQEKISLLLMKIDKRIETQNKIIEDLKTLKNTIKNQIYINYNRVDLKKLATLKNGYAFKSEEYDEEGQYEVITITNVTGERYITKSKNKLKTIPNDIQKHQLLKPNDILISMTGNVGRVSKVKEKNCLLNQRVGLLEIKSIRNETIFQLLQSKQFTDYLVSRSQGAAQLNCGKNDIESFKIPYSEDKNFRTTITLLITIDNKLEIEKSILKNIQLLKIFLLNNLFI